MQLIPSVSQKPLNRKHANTRSQVNIEPCPSEISPIAYSASHSEDAQGRTVPQPPFRLRERASSYLHIGEDVHQPNDEQHATSTSLVDSTKRFFLQATAQR